MSDTSIKQLAKLIGAPVETLLQQLQDAGMKVSGADETITDKQKLALLEHIRTGASANTPAKKSSGKISLKRRTSSEIDVSNSHGKSSVSIEVRRKKNFSRPAPVATETNTANIDELEASANRSRTC